MSQFKFLNLDSKDSIYSTSQTYNSYVFDDVFSIVKAPNSYNTEWNLRTPIYNAKRIWLKSIELPIGFCNIRSNNNSNTITISTSANAGSGTNYTITLPDLIYNSMSSLFTDINAAFASAFPSVNIVFSISTGTNKGLVMVTSSSSAIFTNGLYVQPSLLANTILGFPLFFDGPINTRYATKMYLLNADNYINLYLPNLSSGDININGVPSSFKIPIVSINGAVMFVGSNIAFDQYITVSNVSVINKIQAVITDRWGFSINSRGLDYSITLAIEY